MQVGNIKKKHNSQLNSIKIWWNVDVIYRGSQSNFVYVETKSYEKRIMISVRNCLMM